MPRLLVLLLALAACGPDLGEPTTDPDELDASADQKAVTRPTLRRPDRDGDGYTRRMGDCDDGDASIHPGARDVPDGIDNDCDGGIDEESNRTDDDGDGYAEAAGDCDDYDDSIYPGAADVRDGVDNDCDGEVDEDARGTDADGDGYYAERDDCDDGNARINPGMRDPSGDGIDQDCDGVDG